MSAARSAAVRFRPFLLLGTLLAIGPAALAATFVVPSDRDLVHRADAIVIASALGSFPQLTRDGGVETVTTVSVEEVIKGAPGDSVDLVEPGGEFAGRAAAIAGAPKFEPGRRMLLFLTRTPAGHWSVTELVLGKFTFDVDVNGEKLLVRDEQEIDGWDPDLKQHVEIRRNAARFLDFVRAEARGRMAAADYSVPVAPIVENAIPRHQAGSLAIATPFIAPYTATSYTMVISGALGGRWNVFPNAVNWYSGTTTEPGAPGGGATAIQAAIASWDNDCGSNVNYVYAGTDDGTHTQGLHGPDGRNTVLFERDLSAWGVSPFTCTSNSYSGTLGLGGVTSASGQNTVNGETFVTTTEGDVEMNRGLANCTLLFNSGDFNSAVTHEIGHTLGFRHSDQNRTSDAACTSDTSLECSNTAIMKSFVAAGLNAALQTWDQHAVQAVYPGNVCAPTTPPTCTAPSITQQPASTSITAGGSTTLSVSSTGTTPLSYQWYVGSSGNTASPIAGATGSSVTVSPTSTTSYWVRVSNSCGSANSSTATVTIAAPAAAASLYLVTPCRLLDTRNATGPFGGPAIAANTTRNVAVWGRCGVATGALSVAVNVTAISPASNGTMTAYPGPAGATPPVAATLNYTGGKTRGNNAIVRIGTDGTINITNFNNQGDAIAVVVDITGYFK